MKPQRSCRDEDIERCLGLPSGSEDDLEQSDEDSDDDLIRIRDLVTYEVEHRPLLIPEEFFEEDLHRLASTCSDPINEIQPSVSGQITTSASVSDQISPSEAGPSSTVPTTRRTTGRRAIIRRLSSQEVPLRRAHPNIRSSRNKRRYIWRKTVFQPPITTFKGNENIGEPFTDFDTPLQYFSYFFDDDLLQHIAEESTKYSIQKNPSKPYNVSVLELKKYLGICLIMGLIPQSNVRMLWNSELGVPLVFNTMPLADFEKLRSFIHFNDNQNFRSRDEPGHDRLFRIRPVLETLRKKCQRIPKKETLSVDEQMCATKACNFLRQYLPNKPHKWGYKLLVLCDDGGFAYDFEIYSGTENDPGLRSSDEPDLGASSNIVVRLCRCVPKNENYKVFFDNYYTSPELISYLAKLGIHTLGTINKGRLGKNLQIPSHKDLLKAKKERGYSEEWTTTVDGIPIVTVMWFDNKPVVLASSFVGEQPKEKVRRFCKKQKRYVDIDCPDIIRHYNRHMGGVDLMDSFIGKHKIRMRTRKWYMRLFYHLLDVIVINSWILYKRVQKQKQRPSKMKLRQFRFEVAQALCLSGPSLMRKRGRPSSFVSDMLEERKQKKPKANVPPTEARIDGVEHFPIWTTRQRCKMPACKGKSFVTCEKCKVALCLNKSKNCFVSFHK